MFRNLKNNLMLVYSSSTGFPWDSLLTPYVGVLDETPTYPDKISKILDFPLLSHYGPVPHVSEMGTYLITTCVPIYILLILVS